MEFRKLGVAFLLLWNSAQAQVVNVENLRMHTDSVRLAGLFNVSIAFNSTNGNNIGSVRGSSALQFKSKNYKHLWLFVANYDFVRSKGENLVNAFYLHFRYNYKVNPWLRWEAFTQSQTNVPLGISYRHLLGTGPRFKIKLADHADIYLGSAAMFEYEKTIQPASIISRDIRSSNYVSFNFRFPKINGTVVSTSYYQPVFSDFTDYRIMNDTRFSFSITKKWTIYTSFSYFHDADPPEGIRKSALNLEQGFGVMF